MRVLYDFQARNSKELTVRQGEEVSVRIDFFPLCIHLMAPRRFYETPWKTSVLIEQTAPKYCQQYLRPTNDLLT